MFFSRGKMLATHGRGIDALHVIAVAALYCGCFVGPAVGVPAYKKVEGQICKENKVSLCQNYFFRRK
jgi:hypothetical protein